MKIRSTLAVGLTAATVLALTACTGGGGTPDAGRSGPIDTSGELSGAMTVDRAYAVPACG
ncbi:MAG: hypothetical protein BGN97_08880 [Microbacterium sp. 69-10]|uniref:hypothetical protein n=1 Tax=Microbacterium sp. 69-10 TaxID=1895783 RepID=UPI00095D7597|nr:hypothetical protein [Microbacterium sp. 69-10]OJU42457.1 MAG: hypothetical protein BGN97_08880 [Microbacterium sp. 69-10]